MTHVILIGDSVFDNGAYVVGGPDVVRQLRECLPAGWRATLLAVDGAKSADIAGQLEQLPKDATHLVLSVGGNDALGYVGVLEDTANSIASAVARFADIVDDFAQVYRAMVAAVLARRLPTAICTIYEPRFPDPRLQRLGVTALKLFNDLIIRGSVRTRRAAARPSTDLRPRRGLRQSDRAIAQGRREDRCRHSSRISGARFCSRAYACVCALNRGLRPICRRYERAHGQNLLPMPRQGPYLVA